MGIPLRVLIIEDSADDAELVLRELRRGGYDPAHERIETADAMSAALARQEWDVVIADYALPRFNAPAALQLLQQSRLDLPFIIVSGTVGEDVAVKAMKSGAHDYIMKGNLKRLSPTIERELREAAVRREHKQAEERLRQSDERFRQLAENITEVFWMTNPDKNEMLYVSPAYEKIWGRTSADVYQHPTTWMDAIHPEDRDRVMQSATTDQVSGQYDEVYRIIRPDGSIRWIRDRAFPVKDASGRVYRVTGIAEDITQNKQATEARRKSEQQLRMAIDAARMYTWDWDISSDRVVRTGHYEQAYGLDVTAAESSHASFLRIVHPEDLSKVERATDLALQGKAPYHTEFRVVQPNGEIRWLETQGRTYRDKAGKAVRMIGITQDITERKRAEALIQHMAFYDTLTALPNRNNLYDYLLDAIRDDDGRRKLLSLLLMDLNQFKEINVTLGHNRGDLVLKEVGARLRSVLFQKDMIACLGGDVFAILLPRLARVEDIDVVIKKIQDVLHPPIMIEGVPIAVEASIGVALYPDHAEDPDTLLQRADVALYAAKKTGSSYIVYSAEHDQHSTERLALMAELRQAIEQNDLTLHYQPKIDLKHGKVVGAEALVRWLHPHRGVIPPDQFVAPAERTALIQPLTHWVLRAAIQQCGAWKQAGLTMPVSVNLSARNLFDQKLADQITQLLQEHTVAPDWLTLEITESAIMVDPSRAVDILVKLHRIGVQISIDDFGVGYSSLNYLRKLPVDRLKVDKSFVINMTQNEGDAMIVRSTIELAHNLGLEVVAEGVESKEIYERLVEWNCDMAQGYYMSKPLPAKEFTNWLRASPYGFNDAQQRVRASPVSADSGSGKLE